MGALCLTPIAAAVALAEAPFRQTTPCIILRLLITSPLVGARQAQPPPPPPLLFAPLHRQRLPLPRRQRSAKLWRLWRPRTRRGRRRAVSRRTLRSLLLHLRGTYWAEGNFRRRRSSSANVDRGSRPPRTLARTQMCSCSLRSCTALPPLLLPTQPARRFLQPEMAVVGMLGKLGMGEEMDHPRRASFPLGK